MIEIEIAIVNVAGSAFHETATVPSIATAIEIVNGAIGPIGLDPGPLSVEMTLVCRRRRRGGFGGPRVRAHGRDLSNENGATLGLESGA